jgi:tRNA-intron endonuclease
MNKIEYKGKLFFIDEKNFQSLNSKNFAEKIDKNKFVLNVFEVLYLIGKNKYEVKNQKDEILNFDEIVKKEKVDLNIYTVFKDLKDRGYKLKSGLRYGFDFRVYDKKNKKDEHAYHLLKVYKDTEKINISEIASKARVAHSTKKTVLIAILDKDNDVTYYEQNWVKL